jgi:hypothetical protein
MRRVGRAFPLNPNLSALYESGIRLSTIFQSGFLRPFKPRRNREREYRLAHLLRFCGPILAFHLSGVVSLIDGYEAGPIGLTTGREDIVGHRFH